MSIQMVLVGFVLHIVGGLYVAMLRAQILLKQEDGVSNMATRSQLALWMDAVIRVLRVVFAKDTGFGGKIISLPNLHLLTMAMVFFREHSYLQRYDSVFSYGFFITTTHTIVM